MTTRVTISVPEPNHKRVRVGIQQASVPKEPLEPWGWTETRHQVLGHGESEDFYVHDHARLTIHEID